jgi:hypothetical protein
MLNDVDSNRGDNPPIVLDLLPIIELPDLRLDELLDLLPIIELPDLRLDELLDLLPIIELPDLRLDELLGLLPIIELPDLLLDELRDLLRDINGNGDSISARILVISFGNNDKAIFRTVSKDGKYISLTYRFKILIIAGLIYSSIKVFMGSYDVKSWVFNT